MPQKINTFYDKCGIVVSVLMFFGFSITLLFAGWTNKDVYEVQTTYESVPNRTMSGNTFTGGDSLKWGSIPGSFHQMYNTSVNISTYDEIA
jgi:hypothetical protein